MRYLLVLILLTFTTTSNGQGFSYPTIKSAGETIQHFIPAGWQMLDSTSGDLNKDRLKDIAVIIQLKDSIKWINDIEDTVFAKPRILLVCFKNPDNKYFELVEQNNSFILMHDNETMEDPYLEMAISNGVLSINFHLFYNMGSWYITNASYKFRYQQQAFVLIGAEKSSYHRASSDFEDHSFNFLTRQLIITKGNDEKRTKNITRKSLHVSSLKTLKTVSKPFSWEVVMDVFL